MHSAPILVTGAAGFIGFRFAEAAQQRGLHVVAADRVEHFANRREHGAPNYQRVVDRDHLLTWLNEEKPPLSAIIHLGACTDTTQLDADYLRRTNTEYSQQLWNFAAERGVPFFYASSAATYGDGGAGYNDDESLLSKLQPLNLYGQSKHSFDLWVLEQERRGSAPPLWAGFKFFNVYGFGERHKGKMASVALHAFDQILSRGSLRLFRSHRSGIADGEQKRDFILVDDVVDALFFALQRPLERGLFNLGTGGARSFLDLARAVFTALQRPEKIEFIDTPPEIRERYQYFTQAPMEKLRAAGYTTPFTPLESGVTRYIERLLKARP